MELRSDQIKRGVARAPHRSLLKADGITDEEMDRLVRDLGPDELNRCITYVDEAAQTTGNKNKWKDWNLVIRKCSKGRWGLERTPPPSGGVRKSASQGAAEDLRELHELFGER